MAREAIVILLIVAAGHLTSANTGLLPLYRCPAGVPGSCCRYTIVNELACTFDAQSCAAWQWSQNLAIHQDELLDNHATTTGCREDVNRDVFQQTAVIESQTRVWTLNGRDTTLAFRCRVPVGASRGTNVTVEAVFSTGRRPVVLTTAFATGFNAWSYTKINIRDFGQPHSVRFTAFANCNETISIDNIFTEQLAITNDTTCVPTTRATTTSTTTTTTTTTTTSTRRPAAPVAQPRLVRVQLRRWQYINMGEPCDGQFFGWGPCDTSILVKYHLDGKLYTQLETSQLEDQNDINLEYYVRDISSQAGQHSLLIGSLIEVKAYATDDDYESDDNVGEYEFVYRVPPYGQGVTMLVETYQGYEYQTKMTISFETVY
ncbi:hypothetical protein BV898_09769 [Hypsibius exemplaris]|uniref:MAM domain-containing protein n=1 Tax=Hypsibius exemplaris TaxID=2072580 RepID=A0A1W0WLQ5_HYPEX|nr:hypothetical protein BV898_09769 [Hypsibius exemplaris]